MIPQISIQQRDLYFGTLNRKGSMCNAYSPLKNLQDITDTLGDFTTEKLKFDLQHPVDIIPQDSYDGSVNLILNDDKNLPRLIGSRFSVVDENQFKITDHTGSKDTNIYDIDTFDLDTSLKTIALKIPVVKFSKFTQFGGKLPCGCYTFYFKLADADGNESEVLAESGIVLLFIGGLSGDSSIGDIQPESMRMGTQDESSGKSITFELTNIDSGFDYIHVLFARSSSAEDQAAADTYCKVIYDYPINSEGKAIITITGNETILGISAEELYVNYADLESVKTQVVVNNVLFFGNLNKKERDWEALRKASWKILPSYSLNKNVGGIRYDYTPVGNTQDSKGGYYNPYNVYYRVGYWPDEIYRFGVVYIFNDNSLSPVFNVQGIDFLKRSTLEAKDLFAKVENSGEGSYYKEWEAEPEDYYFNENVRLNSRGVIKFPKVDSFEIIHGTFYPKPLCINFDLSYMAETSFENNIGDKKICQLNTKQFFEDNDIKGLFFVRQKRIPTILAQGLTIGLTGKDFGAIPVIKDNGEYKTQSFLQSGRVLSTFGKEVKIPSTNVSINALLVPDAEMCEATFNQIFVANKHSLLDTGAVSFDSRTFSNNSYQLYLYGFSKNSSGIYAKRKLLNVPEDTKTLTDGEVYFSTRAGNPDEPYKTSDVINIWNKSNPKTLTTSESLIRGNWGAFVGIGDKLEESQQNLYCSHLYNIKSESYYDDEESSVKLDFLKRFTAAESYSAITDRTEFSNISDFSISCYRGDCFQSLFTHRILRNFIDPELPTNDKIVDPACWAKNYAVRCTAIMNVDLHWNFLSDNQGWNVPVTPENPLLGNEIVQAFEVKEDYANAGKYEWKQNEGMWYEGDTCLGPILPSLLEVEKYIPGGINFIESQQQESTGIGGILKNIFKSSRWAMRGLASINRADVNAVGLGQWITFPICSSRNLALRDVDYTNATEQAAFNRKRSFYPLSKMDIHNPLRDSNVINQATAISLPHKHYYGMPNVPFIKLEYFTRVINSLRDSAASVTNEFKVMLESAYRDYTKIYGPITKLMPLGSKMLVVFHHGLGVLALNDQMSQAENATLYLPAELNMVLSTTYGSMWKDSVIESQGYIYGLDSIAKVIWRVSSEPSLEIISQLKVEKFLIDSIDMSEFTTTPYAGHVNIKSHYNAFKHDIMFTYYNDILYRFDTEDSINMSDYDITSDGVLIDKDGNLTDYKGTKVIAEYNDSEGKVESYSDIILKYKDDPNVKFKWAAGKSWSLCYNEAIGKFVTFYDWIPLESENIDNIWFSFDREAANRLAEHGIDHNYEYNYITPANAFLRDEHYAKNVIDQAFNNTCGITYLDQGDIASFTINLTHATEELPNLVNVIGFYLKPGSTYTVNVNNNQVYKIYDLTNQTSWKFIVLYVYESQTSGVNSIIVKIKADGNRGACTDIIAKTTEDPTKTNLKFTILPNSVDENLDLDKYYFVRDLGNSLKLWKHGLAGIYDNERDIQPTHWYGQLHEFNFEFIARKDAIHKVFNNLLIISNKAEPKKFEFEVVGEVYDWHKYKPVLKWIVDQVKVATDHPDFENELQLKFIYVLSTDYGTLCKDNADFPRVFGMKSTDKFQKLPYLKVTDACIPTLDPQIIGEKIGEKDKPDIYLKPEDRTPETGQAYSDNTVETCLVYDKQLNEFRVHTEQLGNDVWKYGRLRGNMQYLEDLWRIEIRPIAFKYCYLQDEELLFTRIQETRHRDKYIKIKVRYSGEDLAIIQAIATLFDYSYA